MKSLNFENWSIGVLLPKNVTDKKCAPKFVLFNEKKIRKIWMIIDKKNNYESQISALPPHYTNL